jgi:hypothetical protein
MFGLVSVRYCRAPTKLLYLVESSGPRLVPFVALSFSIVDGGVSTDLLLSIPARFTISVAYLSCDIINPSVDFFTSILRNNVDPLDLLRKIPYLNP